jgi:hypothetical protein
MTVIGNLTARISTEVRYTTKPPPGGAGTETVSKFSLISQLLTGAALE